MERSGGRAQRGHRKSLDHRASEVHDQRSPLHGEEQRQAGNQGERVHITRLGISQRLQPAQVISLLVPDPTVLGEELWVQPCARQTGEDGKKRHAENQQLPVETYSLLRFDRRQSADDGRRALLITWAHLAHRIRWTVTAAG